MRECKPGLMEWHLESRFQFHISYHGGCRHVAYTCICAGGLNAAVLHYGHAGAPNDRQLQDGQMSLLDMGAEYRCYCSDITCSYPVNGTFTEDQKMVYNAVLDAQKNIFAAMKPGCSWPDMHRHVRQPYPENPCFVIEAALRISLHVHPSPRNPSLGITDSCGRLSLSISLPAGSSLEILMK